MVTIARLRWDDQDYEAGVDRGVFYPRDAPGEPWSGLISVTETPSDSVTSPKYQDGLRRSTRQTNGHFAGTISAYSAPASFYQGFLTQVRPKSFGLSYRTTTKKSTRIHLVYNVLVAPEQYVHQQNEVESFSWNFTTLPVVVPGAERTAHLIVEVSEAYSWIIEEVENILYGSDANEPYLPSPTELLETFESFGILRVTDNGDGTWTAVTDESGIISFPDADSFEITWPSAVYVTPTTYTLSTL